MTLSTMNIGIVGLGFMGATHAARYSQMPDVRIAAVCARDERRLNGKFSMQSGNLGYTLPDIDLSEAAKYKDWSLLVADPQVQAVDICGPSHLHEQIAVAALERGKHVLCEKPMALRVEECDRMLQTAAKAGRQLMVAHVLRFWPAYEYLREWIRAPGTGDLKATRFQRQCGVPDWSSWQTDVQRSGGALLDLLIHDLEQILLLFGMPTAVRAEPVNSCDAVRAMLVYENGFEVQLNGGWVERGTPFSMGFEVQAVNAKIKLQDNVLSVTSAAGDERQVDLPPVDAFEKELSYFLECCSRNKTPELCPPEDSRAAVKLALLLKQSCQAGGNEITCGN